MPGKKAIVQGYSQSEWREGKRVSKFDPMRIVYISADDVHLKRKQKELASREIGKPRHDKYSYKIVPEMKYPELTEHYYLRLFIESLEREIDYKYRSEGEDKLAAAHSAFHEYLRKMEDTDEIIETSIDDFDLTFKAEEYISMSVHASVWTMYATGTIKGVEVSGSHDISTNRI